MALRLLLSVLQTLQFDLLSENEVWVTSLDFRKEKGKPCIKSLCEHSALSHKS
jgi:hypothetical protein